jgi:hypothetical protein
MIDKATEEQCIYEIPDREALAERMCRELAEFLAGDRHSEAFHEAFVTFKKEMRAAQDLEDGALLRLASSLDMLEVLATDGYLEKRS